MKKLIFYFLFIAGTTSAQQTAILRGRVHNPKQQALKLVLQHNTITRASITRHVDLNEEAFEKEISITRPTFTFLTDGKNFIQLLLEPGDDITLVYHADSLKQTIRITGKGSEKINLLRSITSNTLNDLIKTKAPIARTQKFPFDYLLNAIDSIAGTWRLQLAKVRTSMSPESYNLLDAEIKAITMNSQYRSIGWIYHESVSETLAKRSSVLTPDSKNKIENLLNFDNTMAFSHSYCNAVYNMLFMDYDAMLLSGNTNQSLLEKYKYLNSRLGPNLKVPVLTLFLESDINKLSKGEDLSSIINETYPEESEYKAYITNYYRDKTTFKKGMPAPDFRLENEKGEKVTLESLRGKVVYLDFWFAACGPCHALFKTIKPVKEHFKNNPDVVFLCISIDSKETWEAALKKFEIDGYHVFTEGKGSNHPIISDYRVYGYPTTCIIDRTGKIFSSGLSVNPAELQLQIEEALK